MPEPEHKSSARRSEPLPLYSENRRRRHNNLQDLEDKLSEYQTRLEIEQGNLHSLFHLAPVALMTIDQRSKILKANQLASSLLGANPHALRNSYLYAFVSGESKPRFLEHIKHVFENPETQSCEVSLNSLEGKRRHLRLHTVMVFDEAEAAFSAHMAVFDITQQKQTLAQMASTFDEQRQFSENLPGVVVRTGSKGRIRQVAGNAQHPLFTHCLLAKGEPLAGLFESGSRTLFELGWAEAIFSQGDLRMEVELEGLDQPGRFLLVGRAVFEGGDYRGGEFFMAELGTAANIGHAPADQQLNHLLDALPEPFVAFWSPEEHSLECLKNEMDEAFGQALRERLMGQDMEDETRKVMLGRVLAQPSILAGRPGTLLLSAKPGMGPGRLLVRWLE